MVKTYLIVLFSAKSEFIKSKFVYDYSNLSQHFCFVSLEKVKYAPLQAQPVTTYFRLG